MSQHYKLLSLGLALALVESISFPAHADLFKNFKADGSIETRSIGIDNETDRNGSAEDYRGETNYRLMVGGSFDLLDDVHSRILLGKTSFKQGSGAGDINSVESSTFFDNAYVKVDKVFNAIDLTVGRQFYGDPNDLNIYFGPNNDDILSINSLDAFRADADILGVAKFQGIAGKLADNGAVGANNNSDTDLWGAEINTDKVIPMGNLAAYYYTRQIKLDAAPVVPTGYVAAGGNDVLANSLNLGIPTITLGFGGTSGAADWAGLGTLAFALFLTLLVIYVIWRVVRVVL